MCPPPRPDAPAWTHSPPYAGHVTKTTTTGQNYIKAIMIRSSSTRSQGWNVSVAVPSRLPKFVQARSAQYRLKKMASVPILKPTAVSLFLLCLPSAFPFFKNYHVWGLDVHVTLDRIIEKEEDMPSEIVWNEKTVAAVEDESLKSTIKRLEYDLHQIDNQFRVQSSNLHSTRNEMIRMASLIETLEQDKKLLQDLFKKSKDAHFEAELQLSCLIKSNSQNESLANSLERILDTEKMAKNDMIRENKRLESQLKNTTDTLSKAETLIRELQTKLSSLEMELKEAKVQIEHCQTTISKLHEEIKLLQEKITVVERQFKNEHQSRLNLEELSSQMRIELENLKLKLEKAMVDYVVETEKVIQKQNEIKRIKLDAESVVLEKDVTIKSLKDKFAEHILALNENVTNLQNDKKRLEKSVAEHKSRSEVLSAELDSVVKEKQNMELKKHRAETKAFEFELKIEQQNGSMAQLAGQKAKLAAEIQSTAFKLENLETELRQIIIEKTKLIRELTNQISNLEEANVVTFEYPSLRTELSVQKSRVIELSSENQSLNNKLDQAEQLSSDFSRKLVKSNEVISFLNAKVEEAEIYRLNSMEAQKKYYDFKISQLNDEIDILNSKINTLEKIKGQMLKDMKDLQDSLQMANNKIYLLDKKLKEHERSIAILTTNLQDMVEQFKICQEENRGLTNLTKKLQGHLDEMEIQITNLNEDNDKLRGELRNLNNELFVLSEKVKEAEKQRQRALAENEYLGKALTESEKLSTDKSEQILKLKEELAEFNLNLESKIREKLDEFEMIKKSLKKTIEELASSLEVETLNKLGAVKMQKILEEKLIDMESSLDQTILSRQEALSQVTKLQERNRDLTIVALKSDEKRQDVEQTLIDVQQKVIHYAKQCEELEAELRNILFYSHIYSTLFFYKAKAQANVFFEKLTVTENQSMENFVRAEFLESQNKKISKQYEDLVVECNNLVFKMTELDSKLKQCEADKLSLNDELIKEKESLDVSRQESRQFQANLLEARARIDELESNLSAAIEKAVCQEKKKLTQTERQLCEEQAAHLDTKKREKTAVKQLQTSQFILTEEKKRAERMNDTVSMLENRLRAYKCQREEAETVASMNYMRSRTLETDLTYTTKRADLADQVLQHYRSTNRSRNVILHDLPYVHMPLL
uniref:Myosin tail domain-containing protein n=1 Tax=Romanomermis culicivorax TaxID=13658 RepID=A0A915I4H4_ROMCU